MESRIVLFSCASSLLVGLACSGHDGGGSTSVEYYGGGSSVPPSGGSTGASAGNSGSGGTDTTIGNDGGSISSNGGVPTTPEPTPPQGGNGAVGGTPVTTSGIPPAGAPGPRFIGRVTNEHQFAWSGSAVELRFTGSEVSVTLDDWGHNFFEVIVDGSHHVLAVAAGPNTYQLASGLSGDEHEVMIYRRTEAFFGPTQFLGFSVPESNWLPSRMPSERRIEIVADSTAVGYGVEGLSEKCSFEGDTENSYLAYGDITGRALGADVNTLGWSGIGVYRDNSGNPGNNMGMRYGRALPTEEDSTWDFDSWIPQAVVVNLGSNDFVKDDPGVVFEDSMGALLDEIRSHYASARIYVAVGSSLFDSEYPRLKPRLEAIVSSRAGSGDNIAFMDFGTTDYDDTYGCDWHPSKATHEYMAAILTQALKQDLGW